jgi:hypothetical protein
MLLKITLLLTCIICAAEAMPSYPGCNLVGSQSGANVMTKASIMGATPIDATNLISFSASQYSQGDEKITVTLANLQAKGAVIHTSAGTLSSANNAQTEPSGYTAKTGCDDKMFYKQNGVADSETLYLTVPSDISSVSSITISVLTAAGQSTITRQAKSVTKTVTTTTTAPTTTTTASSTTTSSVTNAPATTTNSVTSAPATTTTNSGTSAPATTTTNSVTNAPATTTTNLVTNAPATTTNTAATSPTTQSATSAPATRAPVTKAQVTGTVAPALSSGPKVFTDNLSLTVTTLAAIAIMLF